MQLDGERFALATLKQAEDGHGLIARVFNPGEEPARASVRGPFKSIQRCRMDEADGESSGAAVELGPYEVATLRLGT